MSMAIRRLSATVDPAARQRTVAGARRRAVTTYGDGETRNIESWSTS
jgi:hypothetical protein